MTTIENYDKEQDIETVQEQKENHTFRSTDVSTPNDVDPRKSRDEKTPLTASKRLTVTKNDEELAGNLLVKERKGCIL